MKPDPDVRFFTDHPDRQARIRLPVKEFALNKQRAMGVVDEEELSFRRLGPHDFKRRRIIVYRVPKDNPMYDPAKPQLLKIPILLFADETIEDRDDILLPEIARIMRNAAQEYGADV